MNITSYSLEDIKRMPFSMYWNRLVLDASGFQGLSEVIEVGDIKEFILSA